MVPGVEEQMEILHWFSYSRITREFSVCGQPVMNISSIYLLIYSLCSFILSGFLFSFGEHSSGDWLKADSIEVT